MRDRQRHLQARVDPAESIGYLFHSQGAGAKGQDRTQLAKFNREYAAAVAAYKKGSVGGVTPKVTNNHAADAAATESHVNQLGAFLQSQMDEKMRKEREERENWAQIENERIERGRREEAEAHDQEREKAEDRAGAPGGLGEAAGGPFEDQAERAGDGRVVAVRAGTLQAHDAASTVMCRNDTLSGNNKILWLGVPC